MKLRDFSRRIQADEQPDFAHALQGGKELSQLDPEELKDFPETVYIANSQSVVYGKIQKETLLYLLNRQGKFRFQQILDSMNDGVIAVDDDGRIFYANPAYVSILGVPLRRILGRKIQDVEPDSLLHQTLVKRESLSSEKQLIPSIKKYVSLRTFPLWDGETFLGAVSIFQDVTRLHRLDQEVRQMSGIVDEYTQRIRSQETAVRLGLTSYNKAFQTTIQNDTAKEQSYSFSSDAPAGWTVVFQPSGESTQVAAITVDARGSQTMDVVVTPPDGVEAGSYTIPISAISSTDTLSSELTVVITGTYALDLSTPSGLLSFDASANAQTDVTLQVSNTGNVDLQNITLSSSAPEGWTVEFSQSSIDVLEAGATQEVTAYVTPSGDAMSGDYVMTLDVSSSEASDSTEFRVTVKSQTVWGVVGILLIAAVAVGLGMVFRKYGRR